MSWKKGFLFGIISSVFASIACLIYHKVYSEAFDVDFGNVMPIVNIVAACIISCLLMATGYVLITKWKEGKFMGWLNIFYSVLSFASIISVLSFSLPLEIESPEMFPGLAIPMHFFPTLSLLTIYPFFKPKNK